MSHHIKGIVRLEQRVIDISDADLYYEKAGTRVFVFIDQGAPIINEMGKTVTATSRSIAELLISDFELQETLDIENLGLYSLHVATQENEQRLESISRSGIRGELMIDPAFSYDHPPELAEKFTRFNALLSFKEEYALKTILLDRSDFLNWETLEMDWQAFEKSLPTDFEDWVDAIWIEFKSFNSYEKAVMSYLLAESEGCFIHALLLVTGRSSALEYFRSTMAAHRMVPNVWQDCSPAEYRKAYAERFPRISEFMEYLRLNRGHDETRAISEIARKIRPYPLLPKNSQTCLVSGLLMSRDSSLSDYAPALVQLAKAVEIPLKNSIFDAFRETARFNPSERQVVIHTKKPQAIKLGRFVSREPPVIALGDMATILQLKGGKTEQSEPLLQSFFQFIEASTPFPGALNKSLLEDIMTLSKKRNAAAHSAVFSDQGEALELFEFVVKILNTLSKK